MRQIRMVCSSSLAAAAVIAVGVLSACGSSSGTQARLPAGGITRTDRFWIDAAHQADLAEIEVGRLASLDGAAPAIRADGAMLERDHQALDTRLIALATSLKIGLPTSLTVQQTAAGERLSQETGHEFDNDFTATQTTSHQDLIAGTEAEIAHGSSPKVVSLAQQVLPVLRKHLAMLKSTAADG
jgi:putative membrane protein